MGRETKKRQKSLKYLPIATENDIIADYVQEKYGIDIHKNIVGLNKSSLRHIAKEHIYDRTKSKMTDKDLERIGYVVEHPDEVVLTETTSFATRI